MDVFLFKSDEDFKKLVFSDIFDNVEGLFNISILNSSGQTYEEYIDSLDISLEENFIDGDRFCTYENSMIPKEYPCIMVVASALHPNYKRLEFEFIYLSDFD